MHFESEKVCSFNFLVALTAALGSFTYGYDSAIITSIFGLPSFFNYFGLSLSGSSSASIIGAANGLFAGGGMLGALFNAWLTDYAGRLRGIQIPCILAVIGAAIQAASVHIAMFLVGRFLCGVACGMLSIVTPLYQSEISPPNQRGKMVGLHGILVVTGYNGAAWTGYGCYFESNPEVQWRLCLAIQVIAPLVLLLATPVIPESPRWLVKTSRLDQALEVLKKLHYRKADPNNYFALQEYAQIQGQLELEAGHFQSFLSYLKEPPCRKRLAFGFFVQCLAQSSGILVVSNYQVLLYNNLGLYGSLPLLLYAIYTIWAAFLNAVASRIVDRIGRVKMMSLGMFGCSCMMACYTAMVAKFSGTSNKIGNAFGVLFLFLHLTFYASCVDAVSYIYCSEIFPTHMRAQGVAVSIFGLFMMTLIYTEPASTAFAEVGWKYYLVFMLVPAVGVPFLWQLPETKGLSLEAIAGLFGEEVIPDQVALDQEGVLIKSLESGDVATADHIEGNAH